jgi:hypothetical protein
MNAWGKVNPTPRDSANPTKGRGRFLLNITGIRLLQSQFLTQEKISRKERGPKGQRTAGPCPEGCADIPYYIGKSALQKNHNLLLTFL